MTGELVIGQKNWLETKEFLDQLPIPFSHEIFLEETEVARTLDVDDILVKSESLKPGDMLSLKREPLNEFDEYAIRIETADGMKLGYIPSRSNKVLAHLMDAGKPLFAKFKDKDLIGEFWMGMCVEIYMKEI